MLPLFSLFSAFWGTIVAFDLQAGNAGEDSPILRTILSGMIGAAFLTYLEWSTGMEMGWYVLAIGTCTFALLGWLGWKWAQYIDF